MPVDLPPKSDGDGIVPASSVPSRILNWTAVLVCIGLGWWAVAHLLWEMRLIARGKARHAPATPKRVERMHPSG